MKLLEVKSNIAKIEYNPAENHILPSDFLLIEDSNQKLIAQIIDISTTEKSNNNIADVKLILSIDKDDNLSYYNGYIPLKTSVVMYIHPDEIIELIKSADENIYIGNLANHNDCFVKVPISCIDGRVYIQSDRYDNVKTLIQNIVAELISKQKKVIIIDFNGQYSITNNTPRLKITDSFKLPLNNEAFNNIIEHDLTDCPIEDKAVIQSIVLELREYIKTVDNKFLPFTLFKTVIDNELSSNPISGLRLLRNKLWLYAQEGIFAESKTQFEILNNILDNQNIAIIDASSLDEKWYNFAIQTIQCLVNKNCYLVLSLNDIDTDKKSITALYNKPSIIPIVSTSYDSKYRQILKSICKNQILFKPSKLVNDEEAYSCYINRMNSTEFIIYGESELYIPLILDLQPFTASTPEEVTQNDIKKQVDKLFTLNRKPIANTEQMLMQAETPEKNSEVLEKTEVEPVNSEVEIIPEEKVSETRPVEDKTDNSDFFNILTDTKQEEENIIRPMSVEAEEENFVRPMSSSEDNIARPMSMVDNDPIYIENEIPSEQIIDDDFNDEDLDFLDEKDEEHITIDDIRKPVQEEKKETDYDIFSPVENTNDLTIIDKDNQETEIEPIISSEESQDIEIINDESSKEKSTVPDDISNDVDKLFEEIPEEEYIEDINETNDNNDILIQESEILNIDEADTEEEQNVSELEEIPNNEPVITDLSEESDNKDTEQLEEITTETEEETDLTAIDEIPEIKQEDADSLDELVEIDDKNESENLADEIISDEEIKADEAETEETNESKVTVVDETQNEELKADSTKDEDKVNVEDISDEAENTLSKTEKTSEIEDSDDSNNILEELTDDDVVEKSEENDETIEEEDNNDLSSIDDIISDIEDKASTGEIAQQNDNQEQNNEEPEKEETIPAPPVNEEIKEKKEPQKLPYYEVADDYETMPKELPFKIGDKISHPKLGVGVIVDFMHFGDRIHFCRVDFENKGIRLLDPRVSNFEKV